MCLASIKKRNSRGFSLIEVLIAMAILLIITLMVGSIFERMSAVWDNGYTSSEANMIMRTVVGVIKKDLNSAVDGRAFANGIWAYNDPISVNPSDITFVMIKEFEYVGEPPGTPFLVSYAYSFGILTRRMTPIRWQSNTWALDPSTTKTASLYENPLSSSSTAYSANFIFSKVGDYSGSISARDVMVFGSNIGSFWDFPGVVITVEMTIDKSFGTVEIRSLGPNGIPDSNTSKPKDDIIIIN